MHQLITLSEGIPAGLLNPDKIVNADVNYWPTYMPLPYTLEWNFNVQRELDRGFTAQLGYVGSGAHDLYVDPRLNQPQPGPGSIPSRELFPAYGGQVSDSNDYGSQNPYNWTANYGSSNFDVRQRLSASYIYELPIGNGKTWLSQPGVGRAVLGGWQLFGVTSIQTGLPFTPILSYDPTNTGARARPNLIAGAPCYRSMPRPSWLRPLAPMAMRGVIFCGGRLPGITTLASSAPLRSRRGLPCNSALKHSTCSILWGCRRPQPLLR